MTERHALPLPPLALRELVGPTTDAAFDNPNGDPVFAEVDEDRYADVFDFGCGCGRIARQLLQQRVRPRRYVGIDVHRGMLAWCEANLAPYASGFEFLHHDVYSRCMNPGEGKPMTAPFAVPDRSFSLVVAWSVFTHLVESQVAFYLRECARILKPDGVFVSSWFLFDKRLFPMMQAFQNGLYINLEDPSNATILDRDWLRDQARTAGLTIHLAQAPSIRGFQWTVFMTPSRPGVEEAAFGEDVAPIGLMRPPVPERATHMIGVDPAPAGKSGTDAEFTAARPLERGVLPARIRALGPWFHAIDFGDGIRVEQDAVFGGHPSYPLPLWNRLKPLLPDVRGLSVLDVGCNAGFFSVEMKRAGAERVLGIEAAPQFLAQARFVREALGLDIEFEGLGAYDLSRDLGSFDLTLFLGVIYHLKNPLLGLEKVASVTKDLLVVESAISPASGRVSDRNYLGPSHELLFIENRMASDAPGVEGFHNWFIPTYECLKAFLGTVGFDKIVAETQDGHRAVIVARRS